MRPVLLVFGARIFFAGMIAFSIFILLRGHNEPGGGFIGGLAAATAYVIYTLAYGAEAVRRALILHPVAVMGVGLMVAIVSGLFPFAGFPGDAFLTHQWLTLTMGSDELKLGTTILFDIGVYLVVLGGVLAVLLGLYQDEGPPDQQATAMDSARSKMPRSDQTMEGR